MNSLKLKIKIKSLKPHYPRKKKKKKTHVFYNIQQLRLCLVAENLAGQRSFQSPATQLLYVFSATKQSVEMKWEREREREREREIGETWGSSGLVELSGAMVLSLSEFVLIAVLISSVVWYGGSLLSRLGFCQFP